MKFSNRNVMWKLYKIFAGFLNNVDNKVYCRLILCFPVNFVCKRVYTDLPFI